jgi:Na+-transporting methylmalonyl-CoA/oxaloacetate decarboxylase gamma subunit
MTVVLLVALVLLAAVAVVSSVRKRAAREEAAAALARTRAARRSRVPNVSNNLKGVTATQTIEPYGTGRSAASDEDEQAA